MKFIPVVSMLRGQKRAPAGYSSRRCVARAFCCQSIAKLRIGCLSGVRVRRGLCSLWTDIHRWEQCVHRLSRAPNTKQSAPVVEDESQVVSHQPRIAPSWDESERTICLGLSSIQPKSGHTILGVP